jgi:hypothetical protein
VFVDKCLAEFFGSFISNTSHIIFSFFFVVKTLSVLSLWEKMEKIGEDGILSQKSSFLNWIPGKMRSGEDRP